jgi:hypothetical protein
MEIPVLQTATATELAPELIGKRITIKFEDTWMGTGTNTIVGVLAAYLHKGNSFSVYFEHDVNVYIDNTPMEITVHTDKLGR